MEETLLTSAQAAEYLCVSQAFLERDRWAGAKVPYIQVGSRAVRYRKVDLDKFIDERKCGPESTLGAKVE